MAKEINTATAHLEELLEVLKEAGMEQCRAGLAWAEKAEFNVVEQRLAGACEKMQDAALGVYVALERAARVEASDARVVIQHPEQN